MGKGMGMGMGVWLCECLGLEWVRKQLGAVLGQQRAALPQREQCLLR